MKKNQFLLILLTLFCSSLPFISTVQANEISNRNLKVAFIRNHELWLKIGNQEEKITQTEDASTPRWSFDAQWLAYKKGKEQADLWVYNLNTKQHTRIAQQVGLDRKEWSPNKNILAFKNNGVLNITDVKQLEKQKFENVTLGVYNFSWLPNGTGFLVSTVSNLTPAGWSNVELYKVPLDTNMDTKKVQHFFTIPSETKGYFVISTSIFKWSPDRKWIAFIGEPTASLSMDSNTLFVLSADGKQFEKIDEMLRLREWFHWAPTRNLLAYIEGVGRFAVENKHLKIKELPVLQLPTFTPKGYVDRDFTWINDQLIAISRAKESVWNNDQSQRPYPALYQVNITNNQQKQITFPSNKKGDTAPLYIRQQQKLTWVRSDRNTSEVWVSNWDGTSAQAYLKNLDWGNEWGNPTNVISWYDPK